MKALLWSLAPCLSLLLLAAHFYRAGLLPLTVASAALIGLLLVPRAWAARVVQIALLAGGVEWLRTLAALAAERISVGQPYLRMALIVLAVALLTAFSALVFRSYAMRVRFGLGKKF